MKGKDIAALVGINTGAVSVFKTCRLFADRAYALL